MASAKCSAAVFGFMVSSLRDADPPVSRGGDSKPKTTADTAVRQPAEVTPEPEAVFSARPPPILRRMSNLHSTRSRRRNIVGPLPSQGIPQTCLTDEWASRSQARRGRVFSRPRQRSPTRVVPAERWVADSRVPVARSEKRVAPFRPRDPICARPIRPEYPEGFIGGPKYNVNQKGGGTPGEG